MVTGTKSISVLVVMLFTAWLPAGRCCVTMACAPEPVAPQPHAASCSACPSPTPAPAQTPPEPPCECTAPLAIAPDADQFTLPSTSASHLLPALDLWTPLPGIRDLAAADPPRLERDVGPPPARASLLAQACLLTV